MLHVYRDVAVLRAEQETGEPPMVAILSHDEKPGIQAIANGAPDLPGALDKRADRPQVFDRLICPTDHGHPRMRRLASSWVTVSPASA